MVHGKVQGEQQCTRLSSAIISEVFFRSDWQFDLCVRERELKITTMSSINRRSTIQRIQFEGSCYPHQSKKPTLSTTPISERFCLSAKACDRYYVLVDVRRRSEEDELVISKKNKDINFQGLCLKRVRGLSSAAAASELS